MLSLPAQRQQSITCPDCGRTSHNPHDVEEGYCGNCHWWTSCPVLGPAVRPQGPQSPQRP